MGSIRGEMTRDGMSEGETNGKAQGEERMASARNPEKERADQSSRRFLHMSCADLGWAYTVSTSFLVSAFKPSRVSYVFLLDDNSTSG